MRIALGVRDRVSAGPARLTTGRSDFRPPLWPVTPRALLLVACLLGTTRAAQDCFFLDGVNESSGWRDVNKSDADDDDDLLCWAAAACNVLDWGGWNASFGDPDAKFEHIQAHWSDQGSWPRYAWDWWITGNLPPQQGGWAQVDVPGAGGYFPSFNFHDVYSQWGVADSEQCILDMVAVESYLRNGVGVAVGVRNMGFHHAITIWAVEYETDFYTNPYRYTGFWATDSDDGRSDLVHFEVNYIDDGAFVDDVWWVKSDINDDFQGWITAVQGLARWQPMPLDRNNLNLRVIVPGLQGYQVYSSFDQRLFYAVSTDVHPSEPLNPCPIPGPASILLALTGLSLSVGLKYAAA